MFMLYAIVVGLALGLLLRGRVAGIAGLQIAWAPAMVLALLGQVILFSDPVTARIGDLGPALYVGSTLVVAAAVVRNWRLRGMPLVVAGASSNLAAIVANGGYMPASPDALAALGRVEATVYSNSAVVPQAALPWLTDVFAMPGWMPGANIFSIGDVLIGVGVATVIVLAMRRATGPIASGTIAAGAPAH